jgi:hypothetical protein
MLEQLLIVTNSMYNHVVVVYLYNECYLQSTAAVLVRALTQLCNTAVVCVNVCVYASVVCAYLQCAAAVLVGVVPVSTPAVITGHSVGVLIALSGSNQCGHVISRRVTTDMQPVCVQVSEAGVMHSIHHAFGGWPLCHVIYYSQVVHSTCLCSVCNAVVTAAVVAVLAVIAVLTVVDYNQVQCSAAAAVVMHSSSDVTAAVAVVVAIVVVLVVITVVDYIKVIHCMCLQVQCSAVYACNAVWLFLEGQSSNNVPQRTVREERTFMLMIGPGIRPFHTRVLMLPCSA